MNRILFGYFLAIALPTITALNNASVKKHTASIKLFGDRIKKLHSLHAGISEFIATYSRPMTLVTGRTFQFRKHTKKVKERKKTITRYVTKRIYKPKITYPLASERRTVMYLHLVNLFSEHNETMKEELIKQDNFTRKTRCYLDAYSTFMTYCNFWYFTHGGLTKIKTLLARVCVVKWLTTKRIIYVLKGCCQRRFLFKRIQSRSVTKVASP